MLRTFNFEKTPVVELVNDILVDATKRGASDIHFDPQEDYLKSRIRIDGELIDYTEVPNLVAKNLITRIKIISGMNITESRLPQDGAIKATLEDVNLDLRVSSLPTNKGEKIVFTQKDVREIQLAKAAIRAGIETLFMRYGITKEQVSNVYIAGGFGYKLDCNKAIAIGMILEEFKGKIKAIGNSSLSGAVKYLLSEDGYERVNHIKKISQEINLSKDKDFNELYMECMYF